MSGRGTVSDQSYERLFRQEFSGLVRLAGLLGTDDPENVAQEAFVRLHAALPRLRDGAAALAYARRTVVNLCASRARHRQVATRWQPALLAASAEAAEDAVLREDDSRAVLAALDGLGQHHREVLVLRYWSELSVDEAAGVLGISKGTVKSRTARALSALADILGESR